MTTYNIKSVSFDEFQNMVNKYLVDEIASRGDTNTEFVEFLLTNGFPKLDKENLSKFFKECSLVCFMPTMIVDAGHYEFVWIVSGLDAILIPRKDLTLLS